MLIKSHNALESTTKLHDVVIIGPAWPLRGGGMSTFNERLALAFEQAGLSTQIVSFTLQYPHFLFPGKSQFTDEPAPLGLNSIALINTVNPLSWFKTAAYILKQKPKLVVVRYWMPFMAPSLGFICRQLLQKGISTVAITDNILPHEPFPFQKPLTKYFLGGCKAFISMSEAVLADLRTFEKLKPAKLVKHPLYDNFGDAPSRSEACAALNLEEDFKYVLFFGFIRAYKGLDLLLQAFALINTQALKVKLLIAGEFYESESKYRQLITDLDLVNKVVLHTHFIPNQAVAQYFAVSHLIAQTYWHATQSGVTQIAFYYDKPMLVTPVGGLAEIVRHQQSGYVVPQEPTAIADAIFDFFEHDRLNAFSNEVSIDKKQFSWELLVETIQKIAQ